MITPKDLEILQTQGYILLKNYFSKEEIEPLIRICNQLHELEQEQIKKEGRKNDISHLNRTFLANHIFDYPELENHVLGQKMKDIVQKILGEESYLFLEQFVVKGPKTGGAFAWHQDSGYIPYEHPVYLSCWLALDDVSIENGTVYMLPIEETGGLNRVKHSKKTAMDDLTCYEGDQQGVPIIAPKGSLALFSSRTFHRSGANTSEGYRRAYLMQYSPKPIMSEDGQKILNKAVKVT